VLAFIDIYLYGLLSTGFLVVALPIALLFGLTLLRNWKDGLLTGLMSGIVVSLLLLYVLRQYFPEELAAGGITLVLQKIWQGSLNGLIIGASGGLGGSLATIEGRMKKKRITKQLETETLHRCPKCGIELESNPVYCANCGNRIRRLTECGLR
jgi:hypothetical protein